ncbi:MAG: FprA family A-type flavoprotein [Nitrososphaerota archaeon]|nr:FprA family A-type flavoprotein [Nitrososphaerota archaeon]
MVRYIVEKILDNLYLLRVNDRVKFFEALWDIPEGITYNAYLLISKDGVVLFDGWKDEYAEDLLDAIRTISDPNDIKYIVVHHVEQDHSGSIQRVLEANSGIAEVLCHPLAVKMLQSLYTASFKFKIVKDGEEFSLGDRTLKFIYTPWLHWPETIVSYIVEDGVLLSCDAFGGFSIPSTVFDDEEDITNYLKYVRKYIVNVIGYYSDYILKALDKIRGIGVSPKIITPAHGIIFRKNPEIIVDYYERVARGLSERGKITVIYNSMYGSVEKAIHHAIGELEKRGFKPVTFKFTDSERPAIGDILSEIIDSEALVIGVSVYENDLFPYVSYLLELMAKKIRVGKPILLISSYGWSKVASSKVSDKLARTYFKIVESIEFQGQPDMEDLEKISEGVIRLLEAINQG